ncbi:hypothetical protein H311_02190 [Anncaliia algerae PRA109]|nr:hypothetical protein H311_02190 [Anncaliia algerae PRA109]
MKQVVNMASKTKVSSSRELVGQETQSFLKEIRRLKYEMRMESVEESKAGEWMWKRASENMKDLMLEVCGEEMEISRLEEELARREQTDEKEQEKERFIQERITWMEEASQRMRSQRRGDTTKRKQYKMKYYACGEERHISKKCKKEFYKPSLSYFCKSETKYVSNKEEKKNPLRR